MAFCFSLGCLKIKLVFIYNNLGRQRAWRTSRSTRHFLQLYWDKNYKTFYAITWYVKVSFLIWRGLIDTLAIHLVPANEAKQ